MALQNDGNSALALGVMKGFTEVVKVLLQAHNIDVNHADVSIYLLIPSLVVVGGRMRVIYTSNPSFPPAL